MFNTLKKRIKNEKGLSLVELLAVIVILGIIAAIAIPAIGNIVNNSRDKGQISDALNIISGGKLAHIELKCGNDGCDGDDLKQFVDGKDVKDMTVTLNEDGEWEITGYPFDINNVDEFGGFSKDSAAKENDLKAALGEQVNSDTP
ncbi:prepilin-type N-terminal cleavage/methylation domain-containing protein [Solibacillus sp. FSL W8-0474]|uniref:prepilin-type N-terminal cleavage/methylation domain-containing protein n=1 Tax=Solibacillus sp. FSL W8-0474 TaxID=2975336 RepID=UPI0030F55E4F